MSASPATLFARARELARGKLPPEVAGALAALPNELREAAAASTSPPEQKILADAAEAAEAQRGAIERAFERGLLETFDRKLAPAPRGAGGVATDHASFTLVDDDTVELEIALGRLLRKTTDEIDADELAGVSARLGELAGGRSLEGAANPLGPETALEALQRACEAVPQPGPVRMALVNALQPHLALALRKLYAELNDMLLAEGVLPRIRRQVQRTSAGQAGRRATGPGAPAPAADASKVPGLPAGMTVSQAMALKELLPGATGAPIDVRAIVGALLEGPATSRRHGARMLANPEGSLYERAMTTPAPQSLLDQLSQMQGAGAGDAAGGPGDLAAVVAHLAQTREHPLEQLTGELVSVVFDFVLHDRDLSAAVKAEIARLQIVAFKAAVLDRSFFARREHPLRELLTAIADSATDPEIDAGPDGRFVAGVRAIIDEVLAAFAADLAVFVAARERLAALVVELAREGEQEVAALAAELTDREQGEALRARATAAVASRIALAPAFVQRFLTEIWTNVLADAERHGRAGDEGWDARLALVDELVWSVAPKQPADVPRLTAPAAEARPGAQPRDEGGRRDRGDAARVPGRAHAGPHRAAASGAREASARPAAAGRGARAARERRDRGARPRARRGAGPRTRRGGRVRGRRSSGAREAHLDQPAADHLPLHRARRGGASRRAGGARGRAAGRQGARRRGGRCGDRSRARRGGR